MTAAGKQCHLLGHHLSLLCGHSCQRKNCPRGTSWRLLCIMLCLECCLYYRMRLLWSSRCREGREDWFVNRRVAMMIRAIAADFYQNDNGGAGTYLNAMSRNRLGWTVHCPRTPNHSRAHQAPQVNSAYYLQAALTGSTASASFISFAWLTRIYEPPKSHTRSAIAYDIL